MSKKKLFKLHSWSALLAMIPILVISITGSIIVFKPEIDAWLMPDSVTLTQVSSERQSLNSLIDSIHTQLPGYELGTWEVFDDKQTADAVYVIKRGSFDWFKVYLNPYTGAVLSQPVVLDHYFTDWLVKLHYTFLLKDAGVFVGLLSAVILLFLGISGIIIYRQFWKRFFTLRWDKQMRVFFSDFHKMVGITASPVLIILAITGGYWNLAEFVGEVTQTHEQERFVIQSHRYSQAISFDALNLDAMQRIEGFKLTYLVFPYKPGVNISFRGAVPTANPLMSDYSSGASYDRTNGEFMVKWDIRSSGLGAKTLDSFINLHFGTFAGLTSRVLWSVLGAMPLFLAFTGFYLWYSRRVKKQVSKRNRHALSYA
ncbi:PepSY-associated TM helix domain-containing protein [Shewanella surugensis]|uniref:PepSY domain-containing protein n=1 Tax=Shewanella surugensis TaxID=212020 RepID=A0ABT0LCI9_9GAMM|nr:PepSY-associated TM helix domain-containing protein [Shewanella surugensis]MCL1125408.1 PepSY domain-containing protein [Shewanella surugensis]